jgi:hypothetical protein
VLNPKIGIEVTKSPWLFSCLVVPCPKRRGMGINKNLNGPDRTRAMILRYEKMAKDVVNLSDRKSRNT